MSAAEPEWDGTIPERPEDLPLSRWWRLPDGSRLEAFIWHARVFVRRVGHYGLGSSCVGDYAYWPDAEAEAAMMGGVEVTLPPRWSGPPPPLAG